jgi:hypothetical protein
MCMYFFFELPCEFDVTEIHKIFLGDMRIKVFFVGVIGIKRVIVKLAFVFVVVHRGYIYHYKIIRFIQTGESL